LAVIFKNIQGADWMSNRGNTAAALLPFVKLARLWYMKQLFSNSIQSASSPKCPFASTIYA
jgi:hypothetical protein